MEKNKRQETIYLCLVINTLFFFHILDRLKFKTQVRLTSF